MFASFAFSVRDNIFRGLLLLIDLQCYRRCIQPLPASVERLGFGRGCLGFSLRGLHEAPVLDWGKGSSLPNGRLSCLCATIWTRRQGTALLHACARGAKAVVAAGLVQLALPLGVDLRNAGDFHRPMPIRGAARREAGKGIASISSNSSSSIASCSSPPSVPGISKVSPDAPLSPDGSGPAKFPELLASRLAGSRERDDSAVGNMASAAVCGRLGCFALVAAAAKFSFRVTCAVDGVEPRPSDGGRGPFSSFVAGVEALDGPVGSLLTVRGHFTVGVRASLPFQRVHSASLLHRSLRYLATRRLLLRSTASPSVNSRRENTVAPTA
eukprot:scaffold172_cov254-Pinguiococcus_pyrenoidosus.AAC.12